MLILADVNFGILPRDYEVATYLHDLYDKYRFPRQLYVYLAKNPTSQTLETARVLYPLSQFCMSFQSTDQQVLKNIHRSNIGYDKYLKFTKWAKKQDIPVGTELIFGLPGESHQSFANGITKLMELNADFMAMYNLRLFPGIELNTPDVREKYGLRTMHRPMDQNVGEYNLDRPTRIIESEEIVVESETFSFDDFLHLRRIGFLVEFLWNSSYARPVLAFLQSKGTSPMKVFELLLQNLDSAPPSVKEAFADYNRDVMGELFHTRESLVNYFADEDARWQKVQKDGGCVKLNLAYAGRVLLAGMNDFDDYLAGVIESTMSEAPADPEFQVVVKELVRFSRMRRIPADKYDMDPPPESFSYDILGWIRGNYDDDFMQRKIIGGVIYRFSNPAPDVYKRFFQRHGSRSLLHAGERYMMEISMRNRLRKVDCVSGDDKGEKSDVADLGARVSWAGES